MDYSNICQGWIYTITNKVNGKMYVGKTNNFQRRYYRHFHQEDCPILKRAFAKYGIENFEMKPIVNFTAINNEVLDKILDFLECFYIKKYGTFGEGYNATTGGGGCSNRNVSEETKNKISEANKGHECPEYLKQANRESITKRELWKLSEKAILQYDLDGRFYRKYDSITQAAVHLIEYNISTGSLTSVKTSLNRALNGEKFKKKYKTAFGYLWIYENPDKFELFIDGYKLDKDKPLFHYTKEGILIESFSNIREASIATGIDKSKLNYMTKNGDKYNKMYKTRRSDYWSRIGPTA